jgi:aerobic C4-dicarboxylate transport protein
MILKKLYVQVLLAVALGALLGHFVPAFAVQLKVLSDILIRLIEMILAPVIFCTIVLGIARMSDLKELGSIANHIIGRASRALRPATCRIARR